MLLQFTVAAQVCHGKCLSHFGRCKCVMHFTVEGREEGRGMRNSHGRSRLGRAAACSALPHTASRRENKAAGGAGRAGGERRWGRNNNPSTAICYHCQHIFFGSERQVLEGWVCGTGSIADPSESDPRANPILERMRIQAKTVARPAQGHVGGDGSGVALRTDRGRSIAMRQAHYHPRRRRRRPARRAGPASELGREDTNFESRSRRAILFSSLL